MSFNLKMGQTSHAAEDFPKLETRTVEGQHEAKTIQNSLQRKKNEEGH